MFSVAFWKNDRCSSGSGTSQITVWVCMYNLKTPETVGSSLVNQTGNQNDGKLNQLLAPDTHFVKNVVYSTSLPSSYLAHGGEMLSTCCSTTSCQSERARALHTCWSWILLICHILVIFHLWKKSWISRVLLWRTDWCAGVWILIISYTTSVCSHFINATSPHKDMNERTVSLTSVWLLSSALMNQTERAFVCENSIMNDILMKYIMINILRIFFFKNLETCMITSGFQEGKMSQTSFCCC